MCFSFSSLTEIYFAFVAREHLATNPEALRSSGAGDARLVLSGTMLHQNTCFHEMQKRLFEA